MNMKAVSADTPISTRASLTQDLKQIGLKPDSIIMVHSALSAIGWVVGGPQTVIHALQDAIAPRGTLVMTAATPFCEDPANWADLEIPENQLPVIRENLPLFDPLITPTTMGAIPEAFRTWPNTLRSDHPLSSVCARGPHAAEITATHALAISEGSGTPYEQLYQMDAMILLIGVGFNRCTALHFAESQTKNRRLTTSRFPMLENGKRIWKEVPDMATDGSTHFPVVGEQFVNSGRVLTGKLGNASCMLFPMQALVDFAMMYFKKALSCYYRKTENPKSST